jgi:hypothetical protein
MPVLAEAPPDADHATAASVPLGQALIDADQEVLGSAAAAALFETNHSSEPVKLDDDQMSKLQRRVGEAARHLALGELVQAQQSMEGVYALSGPARDFLNREAARARKIFDNCLMASYLWERGNDHKRALKQMLDCSRSFPGFRPEGRAYPPEIRALFEQANQQLGEMQSTALLVRSGSRAGCGVRLNGIEVGKSPMSFSNVRSGTTRVQLECDDGEPGRIHEIELHPGDNHLIIDPDFDRVAHTRGGLWLQYAGEPERKARVNADTQAIARVLHVDHVVQLWLAPDPSGAVTQVRVTLWVEATAREAGTLRYSHDSGYEPAALAAMVADLLNARASAPQVAVTKPALSPPSAPQASAAASSAPQADDDQPPEAARWHDEAHPVAGAALALVGAGGLVASWLLYADRQNLRRALYERGLPLRDLDTFHNRGTATLITGGIGASVLALSDYFWLPAAKNVPAWAWGVGVAGLAVSGVGLGLALAGTHCDIADPHVVCQTFTVDTSFGPLLMMQSLPLLAVPLTYMVRGATRSSYAKAGLELHPLALNHGAGLTLGGQF